MRRRTLRHVSPFASSRPVAIATLFVWLAYAFALVVLAMLIAWMSAAALLYAAAALGSVVIDAGLIARPSRNLFSVSAVAAIVATALNAGVVSAPGLLAVGLPVAYVLLPALAAVLSGVGIWITTGRPNAR